jgi:N-acetylglucosaminyldiphosphoundecaprenol N-acetyl-beta-D-mannosaminyltransferase
MYHTVQLFDLDFISAPNFTNIVDNIIDYQHTLDSENKLPFVITPNADQIVKLAQPEHKILKAKLSKAQFILPDGQPIVWFSRIVRKPLKARLTGSDLFPLLWRKIKLQQQKILVVTSDETIGLKLKQDYANIVYYTPPFFEANTPLQEKIAQRYCERDQKISA